MYNFIHFFFNNKTALFCHVIPPTYLRFQLLSTPHLFADYTEVSAGQIITKPDTPARTVIFLNALAYLGLPACACPENPASSYCSYICSVLLCLGAGRRGRRTGQGWVQLCCWRFSSWYVISSFKMSQRVFTTCSACKAILIQDAFFGNMAIVNTASHHIRSSYSFI